MDIVLPVYNEAGIAGTNLRRVADHAGGWDARFAWRLVVVDDGSRDGSGAILDQLALAAPRLSVIHHERNRGMGAALQTAFAACTADYILVMDIDLSYSLQCLDEMLARLDGGDADWVLASCMLPGGGIENVPLLRRWSTVAANRLLWLCCGRRLHTLTCVVRGYRGTTLPRTGVTSSDTTINLELLAYGLRRGLRIEEFPALLQWPEGGDRGSRMGWARFYRQVRQTVAWGVRLHKASRRG